MKFHPIVNVPVAQLVEHVYGYHNFDAKTSVRYLLSIFRTGSVVRVHPGTFFFLIGRDQKFKKKLLNLGIEPRTVGYLRLSLLIRPTLYQLS
jgi:hypothetical protein